MTSRERLSRERAEKMQALLASGGHTVSSAAAAVGLTPKGGHYLAKKYGFAAPPEAVKAALRQHGRRAEASRAKAERMRRDLELYNITVSEWARRNRVSRGVALGLAWRHGIKASPDAHRRAEAKGGRAKPQAVAATAGRRTAAARAAIEAQSARIRAAIRAHRRPVPPPTADEAAAAVAAFLARGGQVTRCPDGYAAPTNNGAGRDAEGWVR